MLHWGANGTSWLAHWIRPWQGTCKFDYNERVLGYIKLLNQPDCENITESEAIGNPLIYHLSVSAALFISGVHARRCCSSNSVRQSPNCVCWRMKPAGLEWIATTESTDCFEIWTNKWPVPSSTGKCTGNYMPKHLVVIPWIGVRPSLSISACSDWKMLKIDYCL